jgi:hypothetical protein
MVAATAFPSYVDLLDPAFRDYGCEGCHAAGTPDSVVLKAKPITSDQAPSIDGAQDTVWDSTQFIRVNVSGGFNPVAEVGEAGWSANGAPLPWATANTTTVTLRSMYDDRNLYMLVSWADPTQSGMRAPWNFDADEGVWKTLPNVPYYEDKFSVIWEIPPVTGFSVGGCLVTCHATTANRTVPLKYAPSPGQFLDMWHWKYARLNDVFILDDQHIDYNTTARGAGRHGDPAGDPSTGYKSNVQTLNNGSADVSVPAYWIPGRADYWWILKGEIDSGVAREIVSVDANNSLRDEDGTDLPTDTFVPGIFISAFDGDRGDVGARGVWTDGVWTLEIKRALVTAHDGITSPYDVQFDDLSKKYYFGVAVFDNTQIGHMWQPGPYRLQFGETAEPVPANLDTWGMSVAAATLVISGIGAVALAYAARRGGRPSKAEASDGEERGGKGGEA